MTRFSHLIIAVFFAAIVGIAGLAPVRAASLPTGSAIALDQTSKPQADSVRYHYHRRSFRPRHYYRPARIYRPARVYYRPAYYGRRCVMRPRAVWTPYGYARRWVRVCRW